MIFLTLFVLIQLLIHTLSQQQQFTSCKDVYDSVTAADKSLILDTLSFHYIQAKDGEIYQVLCAFMTINETSVFIGNLFESFTLSAGAFNTSLSKAAMFDDFAVHEQDLSTLHEAYRWNKQRILDMHELDDTYLFMTCNFDMSMSRDYVLAKFYNEFLFDTDIATDNNCFRVESANIRGYECQQQTVNFWSLANTMHFRIDSHFCYCDCCEWNNGSVASEDDFGFYLSVNPEFSCSQSHESSTNYFIGQIIHHQTCEEIYFASNQSLRNISRSVSVADDGSSQQIMCSFITLPDNSTFVGTLFESSSMIHGAFFSNLQFQSLYDDYAFQENVTEIDVQHYRWSKQKLTEYHDIYEDPKLLITCNLDTSLETDYILMDFYSDFLWNNALQNECFHADSVNIRGFECSDDTIAITSVSSTSHFHINSDQCDCNCCQWNNGSVSNEDNFGYYAHPNRDFSCSADTTSTTNYWIGSIINTHSIETTPFYTTQLDTTAFPTKSPSFFPTTDPTDLPTLSPTNITMAPSMEIAVTGYVLADTKQDRIFVLIIVGLVIVLVLTCACLVIKSRKYSYSSAILRANSMKKADKRRMGRHSNIADFSDSEDEHITTDIMSVDSGDDSFVNDRPSYKQKSSRTMMHPMSVDSVAYDKLKVIDEAEEVSFSVSMSKEIGEQTAVLPAALETPENSDTPTSNKDSSENTPYSELFHVEYNTVQ